MLINNFSSFVTEDIICTFESGTCDWKITSYGPNEDFKWDLTNGESLSNSETAGPEFDYNNNKEAIFLIAHDNKKEYFATANITSHNEKAEEIFTMLVSPQYSAKDHPLECFQFWYFYGVSIILIILTSLIIIWD